MTTIRATVLLMSICAVANAQSQHPSSSKMIRGSGCIEKAVESSCRVLIDSKTGDTYNLMFAGKTPKDGTAISFTGTNHQGTTTCMQGKPVNVTKWKKEKGIKCPPASQSGIPH